MTILLLLSICFLLYSIGDQNIVGSIGIQPRSNQSKISGFQRCVTDCKVNVTFGQPLTWPEKCTKLTVRDACMVDIQVSYSTSVVMIAFTEIPSSDHLNLILNEVPEYKTQLSRFAIGPIKTYP